MSGFRGVIAQSNLNHSRFARSIGIDRSTLSQLLPPSSLRPLRTDTLAVIAEKYQRFSRRFDALLRRTTVQPDEVGDYISKLIANH